MGQVLFGGAKSKTVGNGATEVSDQFDMSTHEHVELIVKTTGASSNVTDATITVIPSGFDEAGVEWNGTAADPLFTIGNITVASAAARYMLAIPQYSTSGIDFRIPYWWAACTHFKVSITNGDGSHTMDVEVLVYGTPLG
jgi:hypothetical protein